MNTLHTLFKQYQRADIITKWINLLQDKTSNHLSINNINGSLYSLLNAAIYEKSAHNMVLILPDYELAAYTFNEIAQLFDHGTVLFYPASYKKAYQIESVDNANVLQRAEVLNTLHESTKPLLIVTFTEALIEKVVTQQTIKKNTLTIKKGDTLGIDFLNETLFEYKFKRVDFVTEAGEYSIRGGIVDIFSFSNDQPYRLEFFGDEIESIRSFSIEDQLSVQKLESLTILPNISKQLHESTWVNFFEFIKEDSNPTIISLQDALRFGTYLEKNFTAIQSIEEQTERTTKKRSASELYMSQSEALASITQLASIQFNKTIFPPAQTITYNSKPQPSFNKKFEFLADDFIQHQKNKFTNYLVSTQEKQAERLTSIFNDLNKSVHFENILGTLHQGFIDEQMQLTCYTDHQIFERYHSYKIKDKTDAKESITLKELNALKVGDYITHIDHGIGKFGGLMQLDNNGIKQEVIKLIFQNNDLLYINIHSLHKISKYATKEGVDIKLNKLGSNAWKNLKNKTKTKVKEIAFDLIQLYAKRRTQKGYTFSPDSYLQHELEASFMYEDTPDQYKTTQAVKKDMESDRVMDRLVCGDVGFGKTEVAIRAAFKAATDGKQVAVLVPTTILAFQHYRSFKKRLEEFPITVDYLNRFRTTKQKNTVKEGLKAGTIDIVIGTHQIANKEIDFKDLGLLIVDEEHKFGVSIKDKLKTMKENIDTLTLTATPIPRTLQFSLMAARDLSIIKTPPSNRQPIETQVIPFNEENIRDAVHSEIQRGGQVYVIHNRIENIKEVAGMIQRLVPDAKIAVGHAQLPAHQLEDIMLDFMDGNYDVLVSTTIVESGLDVPNANTIIINNAHNFGLADLHQMRGRVGRSNKKAFCYLIAPPPTTLTDEARKRLQAIEVFSDLGAGFNIAMKDLEIRGAGNLLGGEQSGFINDIGFDTYQKILNEAMHELKENEFKDLFDESDNDSLTNIQEEINLDFDTELLLPDSYINQVEERLALYNELSTLENEEELIKFETNLIDRFGALPIEAQNLIQSIRIKWMAQACGFEKLVFKKGVLLTYFIKNNQHAFYTTNQFQTILSKIQQSKYRPQMKEKKDKDGATSLFLRFENIASIQQIYDIMESFTPPKNH